MSSNRNLRPTTYQLGRTNSSRFCSDIVVTSDSSSTTPPQLLQKSVIGSVVTPSNTINLNCPCCTKPADKCDNAGVQELKSESSLLGLLQGVSGSDSTFQIQRILAEGWIEKKGTGKDWFGTTTYKQRWVQLALTSIPGYDVDVPVLHVYWHDSLPKPSMSLNLEKTVVVAGYEGSKPVFNIIHVAGGNSGPSKENIGPMGIVVQDSASIKAAQQQQQKVTRTFSVGDSYKDCQEWVKHITEAMIDYEKRKRDKKILDARPKSKTNGALLPRSPTSALRRQLLNKNNLTPNRGGGRRVGPGGTVGPQPPSFPNQHLSKGTASDFNPQVYDM